MEHKLMQLEVNQELVEETCYIDTSLGVILMEVVYVDFL